jgi:hypothetical protein
LTFSEERVFCVSEAREAMAPMEAEARERKLPETSCLKVVV